MNDQSIQDLARWLDDDPDGQAKTVGSACGREKLLATQSHIPVRLRIAEEELGVQKVALADAQRCITVGGRLKVESELGRGKSVRVTVPRGLSRG